MNVLSFAVAVAVLLPEKHNNFSLMRNYLAGVDEVGRGALFGPVVAAAVMIAPPMVDVLGEIGVKDSKKLSPSRRCKLAKQIKSLVVDWQIASATVAQIDQLNILQASLLAMGKAVCQLKPEPQMCLVDGKFTIPNLTLPQQAIVKGDETSVAIAAASILAKVWRDELIVSLAHKYPEYDLAANKGYGTKRHLLAIKKYGICSEHRRSFRPCQV